jgi:50S ribosomal protein L16 3-hydroxylase
MAAAPATLLGGLTPKEFLRRHWQKQPLLVRGAIPDFRSPIAPEELAGLACEPGVEARLVIQGGKAPGWKLRHGPFKHADFKRLPQKRWTLLVQDVDKYLPAITSLLDPFRFVPNWRIDDLMISYAADGGSVGPHVDAYDVFLLQAEGMRRWDISTQPHADADTPGLELKQVRDFEAEDSWLLMPGDMLYLPPGVAHHGVALGECMTFSIGFRAPSQAEMLGDFSGQLMQGARRDLHYTDPELVPTAHPGEISAAARTQAREMLRATLRPDDASLDIWFGRYMTEPKSWLKPEPPSRRCDAATLRTRLKQGRALRWHPAVRVAWFDSRQGCHLFIDGTHHPLPRALADFAHMLGDGRVLEPAALLRYVQKPPAQALLLGLINAGQCTWRRT